MGGGTSWAEAAIVIAAVLFVTTIATDAESSEVRVRTCELERMPKEAG